MENKPWQIKIHSEMHRQQGQGILCRSPLSIWLSVSESGRCLLGRLRLERLQSTGNFSDEKTEGYADNQLQSYGLIQVERHFEEPFQKSMRDCQRKKRRKSNTQAGGRGEMKLVRKASW